MTTERQEPIISGENPGVPFAHVNGHDPRIKRLIRSGRVEVLKIFRVPHVHDWSMIVVSKKEAKILGLVGVGALAAIGIYKALKHTEKQRRKKGNNPQKQSYSK